MKKQIFLILTIVIAVAMLTFISCGQLAGPKGELAITKLNKAGDMGQVQFNHDKHESKRVKCIACHHKHSNDERIKTCGAEGCHAGQGSEAPIHDLCINCHKLNKAKAPTDCDACHKSEEKK